MRTTIEMLWTGGWDSTFRVIELLHETSAIIQPHYIVDSQRSSNEIELKTMERLKKILLRTFPDVESRVLPTIATNLRDIPDDSDISEAMRRLCQDGYIGLQYEWLSRYAAKTVKAPLELSIEDAEHRSYAAQLIHDNLVPVQGLSRYKVDTYAGTVSTLFGPFRFPIIKYRKGGMSDQAQKWGLLHVLYETWFCHFPVLGKYACGTCRPCVHVMDNGQTWRMGRPGRVRYALIERSRRQLPSNFKAWLRKRVGSNVRRWLRS